MKIDDLLTAQVEALRGLMPPVDAFGLGGSHGCGKAEEISDIDFFVFFERDAFWRGVAELIRRIEHPLPVVSEGVARFVSDYGLIHGVILEGAHKVEYFLNAPETMTRLPQSARIRVIEDRSGWLTAYLDAAEAAFKRDVCDHVAVGVHDCLLDLHDLRKHAVRGDFLPMMPKMDKLRRSTLALDAMHRVGDVYAPNAAPRRLWRFGEDHASRVVGTIPTLDHEGMARAFETLREIMLNAWVHFAPCGVPTRDQVAVERTLSESILTSLRDR